MESFSMIPEKAFIERLLDGGLDAFVSVDSSGLVATWNRQAERTFGYRREEAIGRPIEELIPTPDIDEGIVSLLTRASGDGSKPHQQCFGSRRRDGTSVSLAASVVSFTGLGFPGYGTFLRDITSEMEAHEEVVERGSELDALLAASPDLHFWIDESGVIYRQQGGSEEMLYLPRSEFLGRTIEECLPPETARSLMDAVRETIRTGKLVSVDYSLPMPRGRKYFEARIFPILRNRVLAVVRDVSDRVEFLDKEKEARSSAEAALDARDSFLSIASHELRTPITSIRLATQNIERLLDRDNQPLPKGVASCLDVLGRQTRRLATLLETLLDVSRIEGRGLELRIEVTDLTKLVKEILDAHDHECRHVGCAVSFQGEGALEIAVDVPRIEQVVTNLLANAIKYGAGKPVEVTVCRQANEAIFTISDHGIGISTELQEQIFLRFSRGVADRAFGGMGLGLYISREIVAAHGGRIEVESREGEGATFRVFLPKGQP